MKTTKFALALALALLWAMPARAIDVAAPLTSVDGVAGCPTCVLETSPAQYSIPVWGTTQELNAITPSSQTTYALFSAGSSANPAFRAMAISDIPFVKSTANGTKVVTSTDAAVTNGNYAKWDTDGNLVDGGAGSTSIVPDTFIKSETKVSNGATTVYMDLAGALSTTDDLGSQSVVPAGTWGNLRCSASQNGTAATITVATGTCGSGLGASTVVTPSMTTANSVYADTTHTIATTAGQCMNLVIAKTSFAAVAWVSCTLQKTANS